MTLTDLESDVLMNGIGRNDYLDGDIGAAVWSNSVHDFCRTCKKSQVPGVVGSLAKKGLVSCNGESVKLTAAGVALVMGA